MNTFDVHLGLANALSPGVMGLTLTGFVGLYLYMYDEASEASEAGLKGEDGLRLGSESQESVLWRDLHFMGYDALLQLTRATTYVLSTHCNTNQVLVTKVLTIFNYFD